MANIVDPTSATVAVVDTTNKSLRVVQRPIISTTLGSYQCCLSTQGAAPANSTGVVTAGLAVANSNFWTFRYTGAALCLIESVKLDGIAASTAFAAGVKSIQLYVARAYTASMTNGNVATLTGNNCKLRTSMATTGVGDIRIINTALLAGTSFTLDAQAVGGLTQGNTTDEEQGMLFDAYEAGHPIVLANNEGLLARIVVPATGVWGASVTVKWTEVTSAEWN